MSIVQGRVAASYHWIILTVGTLVVFAALGLARFGYTMLLPSMQAGLDMNNEEAGLLATANLAGYLVLAVAGGALAARLGPRVVIGAGLLVVAAGMLLTGLAGSMSGAVAWRTLTGVGSGASNVPVMGLISAWFAKRRRGLAAGIGVTGSSFALIMLGPSVPHLLNAHGENGWRVCWFIFAAVAFVLAILAFAALRNAPSETGTAAGEVREPPGGGDEKVQWGKVYRSIGVWHVGLVYVAYGFSYIIYMTFFTKHLIAEGGYTHALAGRLFMLMGWTSLLCGLIWGWVSDRIGRKGALMIVYAIQSAAFALFALWPTPAGLTVSAILFGLTAWSIPAIMAAICGDMLGPRLAPAGLGFVTCFFGIGQALGPYVAGIIADATGRIAPAFILASAVSLLGAAGAGFLRHTSATSD